jgi:hypothetical protein
MIICKLNDENTVELDMQGEVTAHDYKSIRPELSGYFEKFGRLKFLIVVKEIQSFSLGAVFEDIRFELQNLKNIGTTAIVGNKRTQERLSGAINKVFPAEVKFFENKNEASSWLHAR